MNNFHYYAALPIHNLKYEAVNRVYKIKEDDFEILMYLSSRIKILDSKIKFEDID